MFVYVNNRLFGVKLAPDKFRQLTEFNLSEPEYVEIDWEYEREMTLEEQETDEQLRWVDIKDAGLELCGKTFDVIHVVLETLVGKRLARKFWGDWRNFPEMAKAKIVGLTLALTLSLLALPDYLNYMARFIANYKINLSTF